jgi:hypothetical protein
MSCQLHAPAALPPGKDPPPPGTHRIESWMGPRAGRAGVEKRKSLALPGLELVIQPETSCYTD